jgi:hypothetical protein
MGLSNETVGNNFLATGSVSTTDLPEETTAKVEKMTSNPKQPTAPPGHP